MPTATTRIIVVDDEAPIRNLLTRWLTQWGYATQSAATAEIAIDIGIVNARIAPA